MAEVKESSCVPLDRLTGKELLRLLKLNIFCRDYERPERAGLRVRLARWLGNVALSIIGWTFVFVFVLVGIVPPYVDLQFILFGIGILQISVLIAARRGAFQRRFNGWGTLISKGALVLLSLIALPFLSQIGASKAAINLAEKKAKADSITPDEKYWLEFKQEGERLRLERAAKERSQKLEDERIAKEAKAAAEIYAERDKAEAEIREAEIREENKGQRKFYDSLGAPKLLYKCNNSNLERAYGAKVGSINSLLANAQENCGAAGYEIIKRKE